MSVQNLIYDMVIEPQRFAAYLQLLPRWRRPWAKLGRAYRIFIFKRIESPWGWLVLQTLMPEFRSSRMQSREAFELSKSRRFRLIESIFWAPLHYVLHPLMLREPITRLIRTIREKARRERLRTGSFEEKMDDWNKRMLKAGPLPKPGRA